MGYLYEDLSQKIIGLAIDIHKELGPGLLESTYQQCMAHELAMNEIPYKKECPLPVNYKGIRIDAGYRIDFLVDDKIIIELKSVELIVPVHRAQILTYLKLSNKKLGLLINFNVSKLIDGIDRIILEKSQRPLRSLR